jgi:hypothetical protein
MGKKSRQKQSRQAEPKQTTAGARCVVRPARTSAGQAILLAVIIAVSVLGVYWKSLDNKFLTWDDSKYIYENPLVNGYGGLTAIWSDIRSDRLLTHYYPFTITTFWIEKHLVDIPPISGGPDEAEGIPAPPLFHVTQLVLHIVNSMLIFFVLRAMGAGLLVSAFTCVIFSLHPVNVETVAWLSERKNLLSSMFFWLSLLTYIRFRQGEAVTSGSRGAAKYSLSIFFFVCALFSKAATVVLAPVIICTDRLLDKRWTMRSVIRSVPFFAMWLVMGMVTAKREEMMAAPIHIDLLMRPFIAVSAIAHYFVKMVIPVNLAAIYPRWELSLSEPRYWISAAGVIAACLLIWRYRDSLEDLWFWGLALFIFTISPILGLKYFSWMSFSFVADHYMYLGSSGQG